MNLKKAKKIRQYLRAQSTNPKDAVYVAKVFHRRVTFLDRELKPRTEIVELRTYRLTELCGRRQYKEMKKAHTSC